MRLLVRLNVSFRWSFACAVELVVFQVDQVGILVRGVLNVFVHVWLLVRIIDSVQVILLAICQGQGLARCLIISSRVILVLIQRMVPVLELDAGNWITSFHLNIVLYVDFVLNDVVLSLQRLLNILTSINVGVSNGTSWTHCRELLFIVR